MRKILFTLTALALTVALFAQTPVKLSKREAASIPVKVHALTGNEVGEAAPAQFANMLRSGSFIGATYYDLQTNGSMSNRILSHSDGTVSAIWTTCGPSASSRGTGYNYYNGSSWINPATYEDRIESVRNGWGTIGAMGNAEIVASHNGSTGLIISTRANKGTGDWNETLLTGPEVSNGSATSTCLLWPAIATNGNTVHLIACTESDACYLYQGIQTCLVYYRGTYSAETNTVTWETPRVVGNVTASQVGSFSGDSYSISANGNTVAILVANTFTDAFLWKSTDNGANFVKTTVINSFVPDGYVESTTLVTDTPFVSDGSCAVAVDANGVAHVAIGLTRFMNDDITDGSYSYFPGVDGLLYWNENKPYINCTSRNTLDPDTLKAAGYTVFTRVDLDGDDTVWYLNSGTFPSYGMGSTSTPQLAVNGTNVYIVYTSLLDVPFYDVNSTSYYRGVFGTRSTDGGSTWNNGTSWLSYNKNCYYISDWANYTMDGVADVLYIDGESMFPAIGQNIVNGNLNITWQQDFYAGSEIKEQSVAVAGNESNIYYLKVAADSLGIYNNTVEIPQGLWIDHTGIADNTLSAMKLYPNPANNNVNVEVASTENTNGLMTITNLMGQVVSSQSVALNNGNNLVNVNISNLTSGIYMLSIKTNKGTSTQKLVVK